MRFITRIAIASIIGAMALLSSCEKDAAVRYTSDFQNQFSTNIEVDYHESSQRTQVFVFFSTNIFLEFHTYRTMKLPEDAYLTVNGNALPYQPYGYFIELEGKPNCTIELKDIDGKIYRNTLFPPDTAYFVSFPDSITSSSEFDFEVNAPILDSNESSSMCSDITLFERDCIYGNSQDSVFTFFNFLYQSPPNNLFYFLRHKRIKKPDLPEGGGRIQYNYIVEKQY